MHGKEAFDRACAAIWGAAADWATVLLVSEGLAPTRMSSPCA